MTLELDDTICAVASPFGPAERGIVRISGVDSAARLAPLFTPDDRTVWQQSRVPRRHPGTLLLAPPDLRIPAAAHFWPTARSYTGEPMIELHLIGSPPVLERLLAELHTAGIRPARPGEFTLRAFLHGKLDLVQAEAVLGVIDADETAELQLALQQLAGGLSHRLSDLRRDLLELLADLEAGLDFVDEDIEFVSREEIRRRLSSARTEIDALLAHQASRTTRERGFRVVLAGLPNAGKSTLLNALAARDVSIVSSIPGTTRDYLAASLTWDGVPLELIDTAGWEVARDAAMNRAQELRLEQVRQADLVLWCSAGNLDAADRMQDAVQRELCRATSRALLSLRTKGDLATGEEADAYEVSVSVLEGEGIAELRRAVLERLQRPTAGARAMIGSTAARCSGVLEQIRETLDQALLSISAGAGDEILAIEIRRALDGLGQILGVIYTDDILDRIFSKFCIGK